MEKGLVSRQRLSEAPQKILENDSKRSVYLDVYIKCLLGAVHETLEQFSLDYCTGNAIRMGIALRSEAET